MLFMTYKPKAAKNVKAEQITKSNVEEIAASFFGVSRVTKDDDVLQLKIGTLDGPLIACEGEWIVRTDDSVVVMSDEDFTKTYERARNTRDS